MLLNVRRRLRLLCGLPDSDSPLVSSSSEGEKRGATTATALRSLFSHLRATCLPFLRIAAFIMQEITNIDVPASHCQPSADKSVDEFTLLLAYLGLPLGPEDLLTVLSTECADMEEPSSMKCPTSNSALNIDSLRLYRQDRVERRGGGRLLYIRASLAQSPYVLNISSFSGNLCFSSEPLVWHGVERLLEVDEGYVDLVPVVESLCPALERLQQVCRAGPSIPEPMLAFR
nr:unnamed protein product [Spirometra erinaceieuropaei]